MQPITSNTIAITSKVLLLEKFLLLYFRTKYKIINLANQKIR